MQLIDFHSHILPGIDDGATDLEETRKLLLSEKQQGVCAVVATPHCYQNQTTAEFVAHRDEAFSLVKQYFGASAPRVVLGAEVELYLGLSQREEIKKLCVTGTNYMLVEMPFCYWNEWHYQELDKLINNHGILPIIAHLDRYVGDVNELRNVEKLFEREVVVQINAESLMYFSFRRIFKRLVKRGVPMILGSDCHDAVKRPCYMASAAKIIQKKYGAEYLDSMMKLAASILDI